MPINKGLYSSKRDNWETPQALFNQLNRKYKFDLDAAATEHNTKCPHYWGKGFKSDSLSEEWRGNVFLNPPYGREIGKFVKKAFDEYVAGRARTVVMLLPARTDTKWFHDYIYNYDFASIEFLKGRLKFETGGKPSKDAAPFPSMIVVYR